MGKIDVSGCCHNSSTDGNGMCEIYKCRCYQRFCHYRQLQQLKDYIKEDLAPTCQRLQKENDELKEELKTYIKMFDNEEFRVALTDIRTGERELWQKYKHRMIKAEKVFDEIEEMCKLSLHCDNCYEISQKINEVKEGEE